MKPRVRPVTNLYFRWGKSLGLDANDVAMALSEAGVIQLLEPNMYHETGKLKDLSKSEFDQTIGSILNSYKKSNR